MFKSAQKQIIRNVTPQTLQSPIDKQGRFTHMERIIYYQQMIITLTQMQTFINNSLETITHYF